MRRRCSRMHFNPRSPDGERRSFPRRARRTGRDFNPRSPDGERRGARSHPCSSAWHFNPRSPDGERLGLLIVIIYFQIFQSTLPGWGATGSSPTRWRRPMNFNPRSPDGERPRLTAVGYIIVYISIHAPRMGSDSMLGVQMLSGYDDFNPRSPDGERRLRSPVAICFT